MKSDLTFYEEIMPKKRPEPFFRQQTQSWYVTLNGKQHPLGKDESEAWRQYYILMANYVREPKPTNRPAKVSRDAPVHVLLNAFLGWVKKNRAIGTYDSYKFYCSSFAKFIPKTLKVSQAKPLHVEDWFDNEFPDATMNTRGIAYRTIKRAFNWAVKSGRIDDSPIKNLAGVVGQPRDTVITPDQFKHFIKQTGSQQFKNIAEFLWFTGCRPFEAYQTEARHVDKTGCIVFDVDQSKGKRKQRVIPLPPKMKKLVKQLANQYPSGPIFRNTRGNPWNADSLNSAFDRVAAKVNFNVFPYAFRHSFVTRAVEKGLNPIQIANIVGHDDLKMIHRVYNHMDKKSKSLQDLAASVSE